MATTKTERHFVKSVGHPDNLGAPKLEIKPVKEKVISSFEGEEEQFRKLLASAVPEESTELDAIGHIQNGVLYLNPNSAFFKYVSYGMKLTKLAQKIKYRLDKYDGFFRKYGQSVVELWNSKAPKSKKVCSVKIFSKDTENCVMVTVKDKYSIKKPDLLDLKPALGERYKDLFDEKLIFTLKDDDDNRKLLVGALSRIFGQDVMEKFFDITLVIDTRPGYGDALKELPKTLQAALNDVVTRHSPAVTFK